MAPQHPGWVPVAFWLQFPAPWPSLAPSLAPWAWSGPRSAGPGPSLQQPLPQTLNMGWLCVPLEDLVHSVSSGAWAPAWASSWVPVTVCEVTLHRKPAASRMPLYVMGTVCNRGPHMAGFLQPSGRRQGQAPSPTGDTLATAASRSGLRVPHRRHHGCRCGQTERAHFWALHPLSWGGREDAKHLGAVW